MEGRSIFLVALISQCLVLSAMGRNLQSFSDEKNYYPTPTTTPTTPHYSGGTPTYGSSPSTPTYVPHPSTPTYTTPSVPAYTTPSTPTYTTPSTPTYTTPSTPTYTTPSTPTYSTPGTISPLIPDPHTFVGTCDYWKNHPEVIRALLGSFFPGNIVQYFGAPCGAALGHDGANLMDALSNTKTDGIGALMREGTAAFLNSLVNRDYPYTSQQVRDCIVAAAATSESAAAAQAEIFRKANEHKP